jgi:DNA-binding NarL/FixJ family response regulator
VGEGDLRSQLDQIPDVEIVGGAHSQGAAVNQVETIHPDFLLVDLMLPR